MENITVVDFVFSLFLLCFLLQLYFYVFRFLFFSFYQPAGVLKSKQPFVSVIIAAKNEAENLKRYLPLILNQDYPDFEVVLIDDHSTDGTSDFLKGMQHPHLQMHQLYDKRGKKAAIMKGIEKAQYDKMIFIDADCRPQTTYWLRLMSEKLIDKKSIVLGHGRYLSEPTLLNKIIRFEAFTTAAQYFSAALMGKAYMGIGRNLAYTKAVYNDSSAFQKYEHIASGDDDLLVNEMAATSTVNICVQQEAHTLSKAKDSWKDYFIQKRRHLQAGEQYQRKDRIRLAIFGIAQLLFFVSLLWLLVDFSYIRIVLSIIGIKLILQYFLYHKMMQKLKDDDLLWWSPFLEIFHLFLMIIIGISTWIWKVDRWK